MLFSYQTICICITDLLAVTNNCFYFRQYKLESELRDMSWLISSELLIHRQTAGVSSMRSMASMVSNPRFGTINQLLLKK